ncbi:unnamed protein product [Gongylonema pulchrum]|uniref:Guanylate cyclase domain-containing protein n=1 Tax=Gongylonema pulchrum TaxID=637853 RepID=A0A183DSA0_9BILA|nr:unnamed protein product [Gongylonema pulchrum]
MHAMHEDLACRRFKWALDGLLLEGNHVETIGDAYMIVSGLPKENGNAHVENIADVALKMRAFVCKFKLAHRPNEQLMVRIGFHSGAVAAGVISDQSYNLLHSYYPRFQIIERGKISVKVC